MLSEKHIAQLRTLLQGKKKQILESATGDLAYTMDTDRLVGNDPLDKSTEQELFSAEMQLRGRHNAQLAPVEHALTRLESGEIDVCEECEEPIPAARLVARPTATLCVDCQEELERERSARNGAMGVDGSAAPGFGTGIDTEDGNSD